MLTKKQCEKIEKKLNELLENAEKRLSNYHIEWTSFGPLSVYFGAGKYVRMFPLAPNGSIVIGSIEVNQEKQGKGFFKTFFNEIEILADKRNMRIVFESVINPQLESWLKTKGYELYPGGSYYKDVKEYNIKNQKELLKENLNNENKKVKYEKINGK